jgi:hypothetical protein
VSFGGYGGYWGAGGYGHGYHHGYHHGYRHGFGAGYIAGSNQGGRVDHYNRNAYQNRGDGSVRQTANRPTQQPAGGRGQGSRVKPSQQPNNVYADRNGNVYRNNNGNWQQRNDGNWSPTQNRPAQQPSGTDRPGASQQPRPSTNDLNKQYQARERSNQRQQNYQRSQRSSSRPSGRMGGGGGRRR